MTRTRLVLLTAITMVAFASNSVLCRLALARTAIDPGSFTAVRLVSGAAMLVLLMALRGRGPVAHGSWPSALALFVYAAAFSFAYVRLPTGVGALLLFGAVQLTMLAWAHWRRERQGLPQYAGMVAATAGLALLVWPRGPVVAADAGATLLMIAAGLAWGVYSLRGRGAQDASAATCGNFVRSVPFAAMLGLWGLANARVDSNGLALAVASGALSSGLGYVIWYMVTPHLRAAVAAVVQLSAPVIAAVAGVLLLGETMTAVQVAAAAAVLAGIWLTTRK